VPTLLTSVAEYPDPRLLKELRHLTEQSTNKASAVLGPKAKNG
jgi:hypothetical protein